MPKHDLHIAERIFCSWAELGLREKDRFHTSQYAISKTVYCAHASKSDTTLFPYQKDLIVSTFTVMNRRTWMVVAILVPKYGH